MRLLKLLITITIVFTFVGCSALTIGESEFGCNIQDEVKVSGTCASPSYILENRENLEEISYSGLDYKDGKFTKKEDK